MQHKEQLAGEEGRIHAAIVPAMNEPRGNRFQSLFLDCPMVAILPPKHELTRCFTKDIDAKAFSGAAAHSFARVGAWLCRPTKKCSRDRSVQPFEDASCDGVRNLLGLVAAGYGRRFFLKSLSAMSPVRMPDHYSTSADVRVLPLREPVPRFR
jgi:hypothetical protein